MSYIINHNRGRCQSEYNRLLNLNLKINNQKCIVMGFKNTGAFRVEDQTFNELTWLENSANLLGINYNIAISPKTCMEIAYTDKIPLIYDLLKNTSYEYAIIADTTDSIIVKNPDEVVNVLDYYTCDILFGTTKWDDHDHFTMPERHKFNKSIYNDLKLNGGVCAGKVTSLISLYKKILDYAAYEPVINDYYQVYRKRNGYVNWSDEQLRNFPKGVSCDQTILRYLFKDFYPSLKLDTNYLLTAPR